MSNASIQRQIARSQLLAERAAIAGQPKITKNSHGVGAHAVTLKFADGTEEQLQHTGRVADAIKYALIYAASVAKKPLAEIVTDVAKVWS